jgi:dihydrofolate reductase
MEQSMSGHLPSAEIFIATSLDGFIARGNGDIDWLVGRPTPDGEDFGYKEFMTGVGALVMGRESFQKALTFPEWPYPVPVIVLSRSPESVVVPEALAGRVSVTSATLEAILTNLAAKGVARVYVDGGQVARAFLAAGLIRRMIVTLIPVLLGQGRLLWGHGAGDMDLTLVAVRHWPNGFVQVEYRL